MSRRTVALLLAIVLLQLTVLGGGVPCARAAMTAADASPSLTSAAHAMHAAHHGGAPAPRHEHAATHCAIAGCAIVAVVPAGIAVVSAAVAHEAPRVAETPRPSTGRAAPEPPPPRG